MTNCAVLLAGGKSSRMGANKAFLEYEGRTFIDIALSKLCATDVDEILVSGDPGILLPAIEENTYSKSIRIVPDIVTDKGPLGGLYSCFTDTACSNALVLCTDTPLVDPGTLNAILSCHTDNKNDATVLSVASHIEPLIAAYNTSVVPVIADLINEDRLYIRALLDRVNTYCLEYTGDPSYLMNINTRSDYAAIRSK